MAWMDPLTANLLDLLFELREHPVPRLPSASASDSISSACGSTRRASGHSFTCKNLHDGKEQIPTSHNAAGARHDYGPLVDHWVSYGCRCLPIDHSDWYHHAPPRTGSRAASAPEDRRPGVPTLSWAGPSA
jgi:hypothetical protein